MSTSLRPAPTGLKVWIPVTAPIGLWAAHLTADSALSRLACNDHPYRWLQHALTVGTALGVVVCMVLALSLVRAGRGSSEEDGTAQGRTMFLGLFGLGVGAVNLAMILLEGTYVIVFHSCK